MKFAFTAAALVALLLLNIHQARARILRMKAPSSPAQFDKIRDMRSELETLSRAEQERFRPILAEKHKEIAAIHNDKTLSTKSKSIEIRKVQEIYDRKTLNTYREAQRQRDFIFNTFKKNSAARGQQRHGTSKSPK